MFGTITRETTKRASLACMGWIDVLNGNPYSLSLILDKGLQLPESPTVQAGSDTLPAFDVLSDVGQIFEYDLTRSDFLRLLDNRFAHFVVHVPDSPLLFTRDLSELLLCALTAVGLQAAAKREMFVTSISEFTAAEEFPRACGGKIVFSDIYTQNGFGCDGFNIGKFENQIEKPFPFAKDQFSFFRDCSFQQLSLVLSTSPFNLDSSVERIKRKGIAFNRVGALIEVDACFPEVDFGNKIFLDLSQDSLRLVCLADAKNSIAAHLRTKRCSSPQIGVGKFVQSDPVPASVLDHKRNKSIANSRIGGLQLGKGKPLFGGRFKFKGNGFKHLSSLGYVFRPFNIFFDRVGAHMSSRTNIIRRRPQMPSPQPFLEHRKLDEQSPSSGSFKYLDCIGNSNRRWNTQKQVDMVRLDFTSQHLPFSFGTNFIQKGFKSIGYFTSQNIMPILRAPHNVISGLIYTISVCGYVFHTSHGKPCDAASQAAIPPLLENRGFLAEVL